MDTKKEKGNNPIKNFIWSLKELHRFKKTYIPVLMFDAFIKGITPIITLLLIQRLIDLIQYQSTTWQNVAFLLTVISVVQLASEIILIYTNVKLSNYELDFERYFQKKIYLKVSNLSCKDFESSHTYDLVNRTQYDANAGILGSIKTFFSLSSALISSVSYAIIIIKYNFILLAIIMTIPIVRYLFEKKYNLQEYAVEKENTEPNRRVSYISYLLTDSENFKEIKTFGLFNFFISRYQDIKELCNLKLIRLNNKRGCAFTILTLIEKVVDLGVTLFILLQTFAGSLSIGRFVLYNNSIDSLKSNMISMFSQLSYLYKNSAMLDQIREFFNLMPENINEDGIEIDSIRTIRLDKVSYRYQGKREYALKNITLDLNAGEIAILMGDNGSGKTTLVKIIMGIYDDYTGTILVNGVDLRELNLKQYRQKVSVLFQNYITYESSIEENISYGNVREQSNQNRVREILEKVQLKEYENHLSQILGYQFQDGTQISIGQWQKLALGRTFYRNADIYIFDEPNASLDLRTESAILKTIHSETQNKIAIIIMHRFNYLVRYANKIVVLKEGSVAEMGTHKQLIEKNGLYNELFYMYRKVNESNSRVRQG